MRQLLIYAVFATLAVSGCQNEASRKPVQDPAIEAIHQDIPPTAAPDEDDVQHKAVDTPAGPAGDIQTLPAPATRKTQASPSVRPSELPEGSSVQIAPSAPAGSPSPATSPSASSGAQSQPFSGSNIIEAVKPIAEAGNQQPSPTIQTGEKPGVLTAPSHDAWDKLLQQYVSAAGKVNYAGLKNDKAKLEAYLETLKNSPPQATWSKADKMAYWINAYNAFTVKLILDNYPTTSITRLHGGKPWDVNWIKIGDKTYTLNNIENDILRPQYKDARIHFAVNCAAKSCPPLLNRAWTATNLESNFEKQAKAFINNNQFNKISAKEIQVSKIFEWYASDFGNLVEFLNRYSDTKINANAKVKYLEYDWSLNE